jgi:hypothetical protein
MLAPLLVGALLKQGFDPIPLRTEFSVLGSLVRATLPPVYLPIEVSQALVLKAAKGSGYVRIRRIEELKGKVRISSADGALQFARLRTSPETYYLLGSGPWDELQTAESIRKSDLFGLPPDEFGNSVGESGMVTANWLRANDIAEPDVKVVRSGWQIQRWVVRPTQYGPKIIVGLLRELVGPDGSYSAVIVASKSVSSPSHLGFSRPVRD